MLLVRLDQLLLRLVDKPLCKRRIMGQLEGTGTSICSKVGPPPQLILHLPLSVLLVLATTPLTCLLGFFILFIKQRTLHLIKRWLRSTPMELYWYEKELVIYLI